jgi:hypothetical protein
MRDAMLVLSVQAMATAAKTKMGAAQQLLSSLSCICLEGDYIVQGNFI